MQLPLHKTKIVSTIGPASSSEEVFTAMVEAGLNVARLNFSHGNKEDHQKRIDLIRAVSKKTGKNVAILADLPGHKIRIGRIAPEPMVLNNGDMITLSTRPGASGDKVVPCEFKELPNSVEKGGTIFLNDGFLQLRVEEIKKEDVICSVVTGGRLFSFKGLNLPGANLKVDPITPRDLDMIEFGLKAGVDAFSVSFVERAADIHKVRRFIEEKGEKGFLIAKIERHSAVVNMDEIVEAADGIMVARGDLGVEIPLEMVPIVQKRLIHKANVLGKPVITATQMLASMVESGRPTRAEVTDVANAILDGTDAVMLSEETAIGKYPVQAIAMMARIAAVIEPQRASLRPAWSLSDSWKRGDAGRGGQVKDAISLGVADVLATMPIKYVLTPTTSGDTARSVSRFKPDCWILSFSSREKTRNSLIFSSGVYPIQMSMPAEGWDQAVIDFLRKEGLGKVDDLVLLTEGVKVGQPVGTNSLRVIKID